MTNPDDTAIPVATSYRQGTVANGGLTKREFFTLEFAKVFITSNYSDSPLSEAVRCADILIDKLNQKDLK